MAEKASSYPVLAVLGPTASGKTSAALKIAKEFNGVIINCDSRQIYEGMIIGTASPSDEEKQQVEHKLFNFVSPNIQFNASDYATLSAQAIKEVWQKKQIPILVGGTGFYYSAISEGLGEAGSDPALSEKLQKELEENGLSYMVSKLQKIDPEAAETIDINNSRRVLRAIEVVTSTGRPFSQNKPKQLLPEAEFCPIVVTQPRQELHKRIELRINQMFKEGLEREVKHIIDTYGRDAAAVSSIGYREWLDYFDKKVSFEELKNLILVHTRQYAKRQETWFRKKPGVPFIDLKLKDSEKIISEKVAFFLKN
ncbi:MAG: tRNA (adenosine(37)-N6)-dimethylallyltransferase MiaA [Candidatus Riflebacteria bacterium]|nr:tRNA (adenosine(37)-N6)-dimethylallyltransferase MiaA [Candidatus Riflebacteria bacterium]